MFGTFRFTLAAVVVVAHFGDVGSVGSLAVKSFFCLSGFLMTLLMDTTYKGRIGAFALNRLLRLYPAYWAAMLITVLVIVAGFPMASGMIGVPVTVGDLALDILYINDPADIPQLIPTSWAVTNEIVFYILIALGISRTLWRTALWLAASVLYVIGVGEIAPTDNVLGYFSPLAASLPFALGAMAYHLRSHFPQRHAGMTAVGVALGMTGALVMVNISPYGQLATMIFLIGTALLTLSLFNIAASRTVLGWDRALGALSYPIYLIHFTAACISVPILGPAGSNISAAGVLITSIGLSAVIVLAIDKPIERVRKSVRAARPHFMWK